MLSASRAIERGIPPKSTATLQAVADGSLATITTNTYHSRKFQIRLDDTMCRGSSSLTIWKVHGSKSTKKYTAAHLCPCVSTHAHSNRNPSALRHAPCDMSCCSSFRTEKRIGSTLLVIAFHDPEESCSPAGSASDIDEFEAGSGTPWACQLQCVTDSERQFHTPCLWCSHGSHSNQPCGSP